LDLHFRQALVPGGHMSLAPAMDAAHDRLQVSAIDPVCVGQVWRANFLHSARILAMACGAVGQEGLAPGLDPLNSVRRGVVGVTERIDIGRYHPDLIALEDAVSSERWHLCEAALRMLGI